MQNINQLILNNITSIFVGMLAIIIILLSFIIIASIKINKINNKYNAIMRGMKDKNLEEILFEYMKNVNKALGRVNDIELQTRKLEKVAENSIQHLGIVRFNAFEDTGSDLSFAIALLDAHMNGVIISSIFSRHESRIYTKPVSRGVSEYNLSSEEQEALNKAQNQH